MVNSSKRADLLREALEGDPRRKVLSGPILRGLRALACFQKADDLAAAAGIAPVTLRRLEASPLRLPPDDTAKALIAALEKNGVRFTATRDGTISIEVEGNVLTDLAPFSMASDLPDGGRSAMREMNAPLPVKTETLQSLWNPRIMSRERAKDLMELMHGCASIMQKYRVNGAFFGGADTIIAKKQDERANVHQLVFAVTPHAAMVSGAFYAMRDTVIEPDRMLKHVIYQAMARAVIAYHDKHGTGRDVEAAAAVIDAGVAAIEDEIWT